MSSASSTCRLFWDLLPVVPKREKERFWFLMALVVLLSLSELLITGLVALLATIFGSPETVLTYKPLLWLRTQLGVDFVDDPRFLALAALLAILCAIVAKNILAIMQHRHMVLFSESVSAAVKVHIFRFYQCAPFVWLMRTGVADLGFGLSCASSLAQALVTALMLFTNALMIVTLFIGLVSASPLPSLMFLIALGAGGYIISRTIRGKLDRYAGHAYSVDYQVAKLTHMSLHGMKEMRLYGREEQLYSAYNKQMFLAVSAKSQLQTIARLPVGGLEILGFLTLVGVMLFLIFVQDAGMARISGIMGLMAATAWRGLPMANRLTESLSSLRTSLPYLQKVTELMTLEKSLAGQLLPLTSSSAAPMPFTGEIALDHVSFRYPDATTLAVNDVSMTIRAGTMVGLVGLSGSGKSTLVNLLTGLISPESGSIAVDGTPLTRDNAASWLRRLGYVAQSPYILDASLAENIALSSWGETIDRERVLHCCHLAALDFLDDLAEGIDTILGDRGTRLSGGQAQRVAIARALYSNPDVIIFDEATSSLDMKNEKAIHNTILSLRSKVTMVIIAHRLSTVQGCDSLIWLDKGKIYRAGTVDEILPEYTLALKRDDSNTNTTTACT